MPPGPHTAICSFDLILFYFISCERWAQEASMLLSSRLPGLHLLAPTTMPRPPDPPAVQLSKTLAYLLRHGAQAHKLPMRADGFVPLDAVLAVPRVAKIELPTEPSVAAAGAPPNAEAASEANQVAGQTAPSTTHPPNHADIRALVAADRKKRYELREVDGTWFVRAVQGHSIEDVDSVDMKRLTVENIGDHLHFARAEGLPDGVHVPRYALIHGTTEPAWAAILTTGGLLTMGRNHIHLAKGLPSDGSVISGMRSSSTILVHVDPLQVIEQGMELLQASNGAVLTPGKPYIPPTPTQEDIEASRAVPLKSEENAVSPPDAKARQEGRRQFPPRKKHPQDKKAKSQQKQGILPLSCVAYVQNAKTGDLIWSAHQSSTISRTAREGTA